MASDLKLATGMLLASAPDLLDPNFMHSVSVICEHSSAGAYGLVINKQSSLTIDRLLPDHPILGQLLMPVYWGGPVENDTLQILHRVPAEIPGGLELAEGLYLGGDLEAVADCVAAGGSYGERSGVRFMLGSAGWGAGQLEGELVGGSWLPLAPNTSLVFMETVADPARSQNDVWQTALRSLGRGGEGLAAMPPDIGWN